MCHYNVEGWSLKKQGKTNKKPEKQAFFILILIMCKWDAYSCLDPFLDSSQALIETGIHA